MAKLKLDDLHLLNEPGSIKMICHARVFTAGEDARIIEDGCVAFEGDRICFVGTSAEGRSKYPETDYFDAEGQLMVPGFVCTHTHFYGMFSRGMTLKDAPPANFMEVLERLWWRLDRALEPEDNYLSAAVCLLQAIKSGTTTVIDHHASPNSIDGSLDTLAQATTDAGIRACLCYEVTDRNGIAGTDAGIAENIRFIRRCYEGDSRNPLLGAMFGLHAAFTCGEETLGKCAAAVAALPKEVRDKTGFHLHVAEDGTDPKDSQQRCGERTVQRLARHGILGPNTIAAHCVAVDESEMDVLVETGTQVVHNPESNMNNGVGTPDVVTMLQRGVCVGLGTDGMTLDMFQESKFNYLVHKLQRGDPRVMGSETAQMLFSNNARIASKSFARGVGELAVDRFADIVLLAYDPPTPLHTGNLPWHIQFGISANNVQSTICGGKVLMSNRRVLSMDEASIMARARTRAPGVWDRF